MKWSVNYSPERHQPLGQSCAWSLSKLQTEMVTLLSSHVFLFFLRFSFLLTFFFLCGIFVHIYMGSVLVHDMHADPPPLPLSKWAVFILLVQNNTQCFSTNEKSIFCFQFWRYVLTIWLYKTMSSQKMRNVLKQIFEFMNFLCDF